MSPSGQVNPPGESGNVASVNRPHDGDNESSNESDSCSSNSHISSKKDSRRRMDSKSPQRPNLPSVMRAGYGMPGFGSAHTDTPNRTHRAAQRERSASERPSRRSPSPVQPGQPTDRGTRSEPESRRTWRLRGRSRSDHEDGESASGLPGMVWCCGTQLDSFEAFHDHWRRRHRRRTMLDRYGRPLISGSCGIDANGFIAAHRYGSHYEADLVYSALLGIYDSMPGREGAAIRPPGINLSAEADPPLPPSWMAGPNEWQEWAEWYRSPCVLLRGSTEHTHWAYQLFGQDPQDTLGGASRSSEASAPRQVVQVINPDEWFASELGRAQIALDERKTRRRRLRTRQENQGSQGNREALESPGIAPASSSSANDVARAFRLWQRMSRVQTSRETVPATRRVAPVTLPFNDLAGGERSLLASIRRAQSYHLRIWLESLRRADYYYARSLESVSDPEDRALSEEDGPAPDRGMRGGSYKRLESLRPTGGNQQLRKKWEKRKNWERVHMKAWREQTARTERYRPRPADWPQRPTEHPMVKKSFTMADVDYELDMQEIKDWELFEVATGQVVDWLENLELDNNFTRDENLAVWLDNLADIEQRNYAMYLWVRDLHLPDQDAMVGDFEELQYSPYLIPFTGFESLIAAIRQIPEDRCAVYLPFGLRVPCVKYKEPRPLNPRTNIVSSSTNKKRSRDAASLASSATSTPRLRPVDQDGSVSSQSDLPSPIQRRKRQKRAKTGSPRKRHRRCSQSFFSSPLWRKEISPALRPPPSGYSSSIWQDEQSSLFSARYPLPPFPLSIASDSPSKSHRPQIDENKELCLERLSNTCSHVLLHIYRVPAGQRYLDELKSEFWGDIISLHSSRDLRNRIVWRGRYLREPPQKPLTPILPNIHLLTPACATQESEKDYLRRKPYTDLSDPFDFRPEEPGSCSGRARKRRKIRHVYPTRLFPQTWWGQKSMSVYPSATMLKKEGREEVRRLEVELKGLESMDDTESSSEGEEAGNERLNQRICEALRDQAEMEGFTDADLELVGDEDEGEEEVFGGGW
ncbi:hypothetical protein K402DRAFT_224799 [Aulographum hederae CBS 113979]|uniref:Uncharacterized protein n=1 Tax=Aulographum hederae CBS 113979 TaxID=1176131 RepID=A0A6G1HAZ7_9PEZI|nr:hypothetical protein K402DRAFT_224799 [Aulographum hederae CBS 113979]